MNGVLMMRRGSPWGMGAFLLLGGMIWADEPGVEAFGKAEWRAVFQGVDHTAVTLMEQRPMRAQVLRVRLETPGLSSARRTVPSLSVTAFLNLRKITSGSSVMET